MDGMEKDVSAIGGLFLTIMSDLRVRQESAFLKALSVLSEIHYSFRNPLLYICQLWIVAPR